VISNHFLSVTSGTCSAQGAQTVHAAADCFDAVPGLKINATQFVNKTVADVQKPPGCSVVSEQDGSATVYFNTNPASAGHCTSGTHSAGVSAESRVGVSIAIDLDATGLFKRSLKGKYCGDNRKSSLKVFSAGDVQPSQAALEACEQYCQGDDQCWGCSADCHDNAAFAYGVLSMACQWNAISSCGELMDWPGSIVGDVSEKLPQGGAAKISMSGPADAWFGVGLDASMMTDSPYTLIASDSGVIEQKIGTCGSEAEHCPGDKLSSMVIVVSNTVVSGKRTVVMTRQLKGITKNHYSFNLSQSDIRMITAVGDTQVFAYHKAHGPTQISLTSVGSSTCVCESSAGSLCDNGGTGCGKFVKNCVASPAGDLLAERNPTCNSGTYGGGLRCCRHKQIMLDADQEVRPELLRYHIKFRFWFQEYKVTGVGRASHADLPRIYYQTEAFAGEYDVPPAFALPNLPVVGYPDWPLNKPTPGTTCTGKCPDGPDCKCKHTIHYNWNISNQRLLYAGGHCHAPSCLSLKLYRNDTGVPKLLCSQIPWYGQGNFPEDKYDEAGYIAIPPCLWSDDPNEGLEPTQWIGPNTPMYSIIEQDNTKSGHFGQMASWQMRGVPFQKPQEYNFI